MTEEGILMFLEVTSRRLFLDLVFGLLPGWWRYTDTDIRPTHGLLLRQEWEDLLNKQDFRNVISFVNTHEDDSYLQTLLMANASERLLKEEVVEANNVDLIEDKFWLIFADESGYAETLSSRLKEKSKKTTNFDKNIDIEIIYNDKKNWIPGRGGCKLTYCLQFI